MKTSPVSKAPPEKTVFEQQLDSPLTRIMTGSTPAPSEKRNPWSIESQCARDCVIVEMILRRYCSRRDLIELRGNRTVGIGELVDAMGDRASLCCLFSSDQLAEQEQRRDCDCGCGGVCERDRANVVEKFNKALR